MDEQPNSSLQAQTLEGSQTAASGSPAGSGRPDADLPLTLAAFGRVRFFMRLSALAIMAACAAFNGFSWLLGAFLGGLLVEINLGLLARLLKKSAQWQGRSIWPTLLVFYLSFGATIVVCVLVVRNGWGDPLAFLLGLFSFMTGLALGLASLALKKPEVRSHD